VSVCYEYGVYAGYQKYPIGHQQSVKFGLGCMLLYVLVLFLPLLLSFKTVFRFFEIGRQSGTVIQSDYLIGTGIGYDCFFTDGTFVFRL
jgi:hypothetical protein